MQDDGPEDAAIRPKMYIGEEKTQPDRIEEIQGNGPDIDFEERGKGRTRKSERNHMPHAPGQTDQ